METPVDQDAQHPDVPSDCETVSTESFSPAVDTASGTGLSEPCEQLRVDSPTSTLRSWPCSAINFGGCVGHTETPVRNPCRGIPGYTPGDGVDLGFDPSDVYGWGVPRSCVRGLLEQHGPDVVHVLFELGRRIFTCLRQQPSTWRFLEGVIYNVHVESLDKVDRELKILRRSTEFMSVVWHPECDGYGHLHLYHACPYRDSHCRCYFRGAIDVALGTGNPDAYTGRIPNRAKRNRRSAILYCANITEVHVIRWLLYYSRTPRRFVYLEGTGMEIGALLRGLETLYGRQNPEEHTVIRAVASSRLPCEDDPWELPGLGLQPQGQSSPRQSDHDHAGGSQDLSRSIERTPPKNQKQVVERKYLLAALKKFLTVPLHAAADCRGWIEHENLMFYDRQDETFRKAVTQLQKQIALMGFESLLEMHQATTGHYMARSKETYYLPLTESVEYLFDLFKYQAQFNYVTDPYWLILHFFHILERKYKKKNSIFIHGPPNSGKTWLVDCLSGFYLNTGQVANFNKYQSFPLNDCPNKRLLVWNEPNIEPSQFDTVKMLTGGDPLPAQVKYQGNAVVDKTPVLITSNAHIFVKDDPVWSSRITFLEFNTAPFLKNVKAYPHPLAWAELVKDAKKNIPYIHESLMIQSESLFV